MRSARGERTLKPEQFFKAYLTTAAEPDELLVEVRLPAMPPRTGSAFLEISRRHGDFALVGVAATVTVDTDGVCTGGTLALTGVGPTPVVSTDAMRTLLGVKPDNIQALEDVGRRVSETLRPESDLHASSDSRMLRWRARSPRAGPSGGTSRQPRRARQGGADMIERTIRVTVNGRPYERTVEARKTLADFLRDDLALTGTHLGCEHGVCGACTIVVDGAAVRSCLLFAAQMGGPTIQTVEGLADGERLNPLQEAFREHHGLQCGFCTPGFLMTLTCFLQECPNPSEGEIREAIAGNLCRCTGYQNIVAAARAAARWLGTRRESGGAERGAADDPGRRHAPSGARRTPGC